MAPPATTAAVAGQADRPVPAAPEAAARWVAVFTEAWRNPVDADTFCDRFEPVFDPEMRLIQPQVPDTVGLHAFREGFARPLFALIPDLHGTVEGWTASGDTIYIELRLEGHVGRRAFTMRTCDRIKLRGEHSIERVAYLDATPLLRAVALSPGSWLRFVRAQLKARRHGASS